MSLQQLYARLQHANEYGMALNYVNHDKKMPKKLVKLMRQTLRSKISKNLKTGLGVYRGGARHQYQHGGDEFDVAVSALDELDQAITAVDNTFRTKSEEYDGKLKNIETELTNILEKLRRKVGELKELSGKKDDCAEKIQALERQLEEEKKQRQEIENKLNEAKRDLQDLKQTDDRFKAMEKQNKEKINELTQRIKDMKNKLNALSSQIQIKRVDIQGINESISKIMQEIE